jgi:hypothetical protein
LDCHTCNYCDYIQMLEGIEALWKMSWTKGVEKKSLVSLWDSLKELHLLNFFRLQLECKETSLTFTLLGHVHQNCRGCSSADQCLLKIIDMLRKLHAVYLHIGSSSFPKHVANRGHVRGLIWTVRT